MPYRHWKNGRGLLVFDEETLQPIKTIEATEQAPEYPEVIAEVQSDFPGMRIKWASDSGRFVEPTSRYVLRWETLGSNRDRPREGSLPDNSELVLYKIER